MKSCLVHARCSLPPEDAEDVQRLELSAVQGKHHAETDIRSWVESRFGVASWPKTLFEVGANNGTDTAWLARIPEATVHAFEPDPRNQIPAMSNVIVTRAAVAAQDGEVSFTMSKDLNGKPWTYSSSIRSPKNHLRVHAVTFGEPITVDAITLDTYCARTGVEGIDFIWADVQGAEGDMIRGGSKTFERTHYLYTEWSDYELYEGQIKLIDILALLPTYRVIELWPGDVLLENVCF